MDKLLVSPLYELAWQQLVFSFKDLYGNLIPRVQRVELIDYMTKGIVPTFTYSDAFNFIRKRTN
jgi:hypothetical protein